MSNDHPTAWPADRRAGAAGTAGAAARILATALVVATLAGCGDDTRQGPWQRQGPTKAKEALVRMERALDEAAATGRSPADAGTRDASIVLAMAAVAHTEGTPLRGARTLVDHVQRLITRPEMRDMARALLGEAALYLTAHEDDARRASVRAAVLGAAWQTEGWRSGLEERARALGYPP